MRRSLLALLLLLPLFAGAQSATPFNWQFCYGGASYEWSTNMTPTPDGGYIISCSSNFMNEPSFGDDDAYAIKISATGELQWEQHYGGSGKEIAGPIVPDPRGGYIYLISTSSTDGQVQGHYPTVDSANRDIWVLKLDDNGDIEWQRCYGDVRNEKAYYVQFGTDGYVFTGLRSAYNSVLTDYEGTAWQFTTDALGQPLGETSFPLSDVRTLMPTADGNILVSPMTAKFGLRKVSTSGTPVWNQSYPCTGTFCQQNKVLELADGGLLLAGDNYDYANTWQPLSGSQDFQVIHTSATGQLQWQRLYGGSGGDNAYAAAVCENGDYLVTGTSSSSDGQVNANKGGYDCWVIRIKSTDGSIVWKKSFGGSESDEPKFVRKNANGSITVGGVTYSEDGDVGLHTGGNADLWAFNFTEPAPLAVAPSPAAQSLRISPNPATSQLNVVLPYGAGSANLAVFDITGRQLFSVKAVSTQAQLDVSGLSPGVYFLRCSGVAYRFVKE